MGDNKRLAPLDSLRGIAAMGIAFFWHYQGQFQTGEASPFRQKGYWFYHFGWSLVDLFFVLSGFIFSYVYKNSLLKGEVSLYNFSVNRFSRLYPLHIITLLFVAIMQFIRYIELNNFFRYPYNDAFHFILNVFFIQKGWFDSGFSYNAPSWSVSCEIVSYFLFFYIVSKYSTGKHYIAVYVFIIFIGLTIHKMQLKMPLFNEEMARVFIGFFIGCLTYELNKFFNHSKYRTLFIIGCVLTLLILTTGSIKFSHRILGDWPVVYSMLIYPLLIILSLNVPFIREMLSIRPLRFLGEISYSIYLWHFPVRLVVKTADEVFNLHINYSLRIVYISDMAIILLVSILSHFYFEKPAMKYLRKRLLAKKS